jgi:hypothetical protein
MGGAASSCVVCVKLTHALWKLTWQKAEDSGQPAPSETAPNLTVH